MEFKKDEMKIVISKEEKKVLKDFIELASDLVYELEEDDTGEASKLDNFLDIMGLGEAGDKIDDFLFSDVVEVE